MSNRPLPSHNNNNLYPQTSTFLSSKLERHISNPTHSTSPSQLFNNSSIPLQNRYNHPSSTSRQLNFETPTTNFSAVQSQKLDFSQALNKADNMSQTPNYILHKLKADTDGHMEVEVSDFDLQKENEVLESKCDFFDQLLNEVEIPSQGSKTYVKPIAKEKYLQPKRKTPALMKRRKENEGVLQEKNTTGAAMKYIKNSEGDVIPDPLTHFTRSNSDVPPTLQSNLILVESKEEMLGDNKYLNNLKDMKHPDKSAQRKQSDEVFPGDNSNHKRNFDNFQNKKSSTGGKSKFAKNLFADFNNDAIVGGGLEGGLFQIPEKAAEYDFSTLESQPKDNKQGNFEIENLDAISKLLNFESETSDEFGYVDGNAAVSPFDAEDRFMSPKKEHFETPIKSFEMNHGSTGKFNLFSTITAKKQSKSNLFSDLMNSTSVTDFSVGEFPSVRKEELSSSSIKETKTKKTLSRFENDFEILEVKLFAKAIGYNLKNQTLGSGDVGTVFKCQNKLDGLIYAIKCTNIQLRGEENDEGLALNEAQALASLSALDENPFIVRYYNAWVEDDKLYLAMEHCQNNLRKLKNEHVKFSESMIRQIMRDICTGLKHLHSQRIVHLDIKPENILYSKTKKYKLADLGLSKIALLSNNGDITEGDCRYLAPELLSDFSENNLPDLTKADIFSFGATIFELITGAELPRNGQEWIDIRRGNLHKMDHLNYSNSLKSIIKSMMSSNADARPSAYELLTNFLQSEIELELKWEKKQNKDLKKEIRGLEDQLGLKRKNSM